MDTMTKEINEIIEKQFPAQVGELLKKRLEQADDDAEQRAVLSKHTTILSQHIDNLDKTIEVYKKNDERNAKLEQREKTCAEKERQLEIDILKKELDSEREKTIFVKEVALGLVRNTEYRSQLYNSRSVPVSVNGYVQSQQANENITETKSAE